MHWGQSQRSADSDPFDRDASFEYRRSSVGSRSLPLLLGSRMPVPLPSTRYSLLAVVAHDYSPALNPAAISPTTLLGERSDATFTSIGILWPFQVCLTSRIP